MRKWQWQRGNIFPMGKDMPCRKLGMATAIELEKMVSQNHCKKSILIKSSLLFLHRRLG
jgi:hypothetical protein